jgi:hypothetical protein
MPYQSVGLLAQLTKWRISHTAVAGWETRGGATFNPRGIVDHHTAGPATGDMPSLSVLINGRADLPGPLANFGVGRSGMVYVVAAGRANHAGLGGWNGGLTGNSSVWGIEEEGTGTVPLTGAQNAVRARLCAALAEFSQFPAANVCGHREWAPRRKVDPYGVNLPGLRAQVAGLLAPAPWQPPPAVIDNEEDDGMLCFVRNPHDKTQIWGTNYRVKWHVTHPDVISHAQFVAASQTGNSKSVGPIDMTVAAFDAIRTVA